MAKRRTTKSRAKPDKITRLAGDLSSIRVVGVAKPESSRVEADAGDSVREELVAQSVQHIHKLPTAYLARVAPVLAHLAGQVDGQRSILPGLPPEFFEGA